MNTRRIVYFADPMCSWCYGFGPELEGLMRRVPDLAVDLVMGGLRPYTTEAMAPAMRETIAGHWSLVAKESALPFNDAVLAREGFVYDTEPACRAVVTMRTLAPDHALPYFRSVQRAFYAEGRDVTQAEVLADLAAEEGLDRDIFLATHDAESSRQAVRGDFSTAQSTGVRGFPTLAVAYADARIFLLASGFTRTPALTERLARIDAIAAIPAPPVREGA